MESARKRAGRIVRNRRKTLGYTSQKALADAAGVAVRQVAAVELGEHVGPKTLRRLEPALSWAVGHLDEILQGAEPDMTPPPVQTEDVGTDVRYYDPVTGVVNQQEALKRMIALLPSIREGYGLAEAERMRARIVELAEKAGLVDFASSELHRVAQ